MLPHFFTYVGGFTFLGIFTFDGLPIVSCTYPLKPLDCARVIECAAIDRINLLCWVEFRFIGV